MPLIELHGVQQGYRGKSVIRGIDLALDVGAFGLLGPNGAGKSTLLRTLATAVRPAGGTLEIFGSAVRGPKDLRAVRRRIGFLPQSFGYPPEFTVLDFVSYCAWLREIPRRDIRTAARAALERVGLGDRSGTAMGKLSGGMLRRAGIAQAVVGGPELIVLDEPTTGLDPRQRTDFRDLVRELSASACVLLSTHLVEDVAHTCSRIGVLAEGRLCFDGTPEELTGRARADSPGDTPLERGYAEVLAGRDEEASGTAVSPKAVSQKRAPEGLA
ncbi:ATP-binding cassette domain-containing protein [Streptomyces sp. MST-110588]|uniref:ATP-binding cassette domain-containing protein n=1 Tax=Streptomyces sp. MST-110588 TaxID=2833628 RepID=UPI001F5DCDF5|nr:ATP-binding cassette domain-containing protein [Streptomyces sp. MST-110588]UNO42413.1 ATP-binding cassette domain-containing protein [Streptomyces sp. MST-110588]